ncbi:ABC transporter permease [Pelagovum pacificum]|uniref:ABC transporter permease n=1 Tax=Pelagovum pacificum TaxID=2588711 RepID=A0A5C5GCN6_9RHOB|nr:ABC transporter permease [Pelagovum pacificum]QQA44308.1 ABC transporter permease [Pelagovum pacificum]TNY32572.1 ABC transporter permease [Pelagovum pacificum]
MTDAIQTAPARPGEEVISPRRRFRAFSKITRSGPALAGLALVSFFVLIALFAPWLAPQDPFASSFTAIRNPPSAEHWLGTDEVGRDILSRLILGARASLLAGVVSVGIAVAIGVPLGLLAGYFGGWTDGIISRLTEALLSIPSLILAIALAATLGPSLTNAMLAIGIAATPIFIRLTRGQVMAVKTEDYVDGARAIGLPHSLILWRYILPNVAPPLVVQATITVATAIIAEASLSFLGLGQQPPNPSWGSMLNSAKNYMMHAPFMSIFPGTAIFLVVLGFNMLGDGLRDALDPRET